MIKTTLYELSEQYLQLLSLAEECGDEQIFADTLEGLDGEIEDKADGCAKAISQINADVSALETEIKRLTAKKTVLENNAKRIKQYLEKNMLLTGKTKFKTQFFSFGIQKNPPSLIIDKPEMVPKEYHIPQPDKIDNAAIKAALKDGASYDWCHLASTESLRIK